MFGMVKLNYMRLCLNTNVFCRPFDDLSQERILKEAMAANKIFIWAQAGLVEILASEANLTEIFLIKNMYKKDAVESLVLAASANAIKLENSTIELADTIWEENIMSDYMDILHLSMASASNCEYFLTCDDEIIKKKKHLEKFTKCIILNPVDFVSLMEAKF